jgi:hypothetical protein
LVYQIQAPRDVDQCCARRKSEQSLWNLIQF